MKKSNPFRQWVPAAFACLAAASCGDVTDSGTALPDGKYPMEFTTVLAGLTAPNPTTRATTDNSWTGIEEVAIQIGGEVKKYTAAAGGSLSMAASGTPFYWQTTGDITVNAWYPYNETKPIAADLRVKANQSEEKNYQSSDYLEAVNATVSFSNPALTFTHRTAKVAVTLESGEGMTDLSDATVTFVNQIGVEGDGTEVISRKGTPGTYIALIIPQQMQGQKFIKVTVAERDYYYTPQNKMEADFKAGKQYAYNITVNKTGLNVTIGASVSWTDNTNSGVEGRVTFNISTDGNIADITSANGSMSHIGPNFTLSGSNEFTVKVVGVQKGKFVKDISVEGVCELKSSTYANGNNEYTYTTKGDVFLAVHLVDKTTPEIGDYYYADGSWSSGTQGMWAKSCIGVVFKAGAGTGDNIGKYSGKSLIGNQINGYAIALRETNRDTGYGGWETWGTAGISGINLSTDERQCLGYSNTQLIEKQSNYNQENFYACYKAVNYSPAAPSCSSGWYLPSLGEMKVLWDNYYTVRDKFRSISDATDMDRRYGFFWTSSKNEGNAANCVDFGSRDNHDKDFYSSMDTQNAFIRPVLTF